MMRRVLISGCALALLSSEALAQDATTADPAAQTPAATAPAPEAPAAAAPTEAAPTQPAPTEAPAVAAPTPPPPAAATGKAGPGMRMLRGRTFDKASGEAVPLVRVIIKGTTKGTETDLKGFFTLEIPQDAVVLDISSQDYKQRDVLVPATQQSVNVPLEPSFTEEMVVVGRASEVARKNLANSVATVKADEINRAPASTVDQALQGKVAGANVQSNSGAPGGGLQMRLRGVSTIYGQSAPLYVIDGVLVSDVAVASGVFAVTKSTGGSNPDPTQDNQVNRIADINPNDIESIEILKGASAAAIYGSKASNGVIIINTKRGRAGDEPKVDISQRFGVYTLSKKLGTRQYNSMEDVVARYGPDSDAAQYYTGQTYDHEAQLAGRRDLSTETVASVSGASGETRYYGSAQIKNDEGIIKNTGYEKQSFRLNVGQKLGQLVDVNASANVVHSLGQRGITNNDNTLITYYMALTPTPSFVNLEPDAKGLYPANPFIKNGSNPLQTAALARNDEDVWRVIAAGDVTIHAYKDADSELRILGNLGLDRFQQENTLLFPAELHFESADGALGTSLYGTTQSRNLNGGLNAVYNYKPAGAGLSSNTSVGLQLEERSLDSVYVVSQNLVAGQPNVDAGTDVNLRQRLELVRDRGYYVQEEMILLDERLTLVGALRGEQSSNNGNPNALFFYPKLATAYRIPSFHPKVDEFKVRLAYGETGNQPLYSQKFTELQAKSNIEGNAGLIGTGISGDRNIKPERQREVELGLDALFFGGDLVTELTFYQRNISDLLLKPVPAPSTGFVTQYVNGGALRNRGVELMVQVKPVSTGNFEWTSNTTFALNRSRVTDLPGPSFLAGGFGTSLGAFRVEKGASVTQIVGNVKDENGNVVERKLGDTEPDFRVGFANTVRYNSFSLSFLMDWQQGSDVINLTRLLFDDTQNSADYLEGGKERFESWDSGKNAAAYIEDASFVKLREVTLTYQLPEAWVTRIPKVKTARLSISGRNLLTFTNYSGLDPEVSNFGNQPIARNIDVAPFPPSRSFWTSIDVGF